MDDKQYKYIKYVINKKLTNIRKVLTSKADKYDIDESMDKITLIDMISDVILEIQDINEFMDKFPIK